MAEETTRDLGPRPADNLHSIPTLKVMVGPGAGRVFRLTSQETLVGRGQENDIVVDDKGVSRQHCKFVLETGRVMVVDNDSRNGTFVNEERVRQTRSLRDGVVIELGQRVKLRFHFLAPEETELERRLYERATHDALTGVLNRRAWTDQVRSQLLEKPAMTYCLGMLDLDHFKSINDTHGHLAGDAVLVEFCRRARGLGKDILLGRWGGEEFVLFFPTFDLEKSERRLERLRKEVAGVPFQLPDGGTIPVTVSAGLVEGKGPASMNDTLLTQADEHLYQAKHEGRNRICRPRPPAVPVQRRILSRRPCTTRVQGWADDARFDATVCDISIGGLCLKTAHALEPGAVVQLQVRDTAVAATVCWLERREGEILYGLSFRDGIEQLRRSWVRELLARLGIRAENSRERRREVRVDCQAEASLHGPGGSVSGRLVNFGSGGACLETGMVPAAGLRLKLEWNGLTAQVMVVWSQPPRCGLCFCEPNDGLRAELAMRMHRNPKRGPSTP